MRRRHRSAPSSLAQPSLSTLSSRSLLSFAKHQIDCAAACAASQACKGYQYCGFGSFNGTCAFAPARNGTAPTPAFAAKGDCLLANGTSWRQAPSKPEYGGWTFGVGCRGAEVADAPVEKEAGGEEGEEPAKKPAAAPAAPVAARPAKVAEPAAAEEPISALHKPSSARGAAAPAAVEAGAADPNAPEVVAVAAPAAPKSGEPVAAPAAVAPAVTPVSKAPLVPAAAAAATGPRAVEAPAVSAASKPAAAAKPAAPKAAAAAAAAAAPDAAAPAATVGPAGPGSLSAPVRGYLSGRASVAELQPGIESAAECASICAGAEKNAASACAGYSWCGAAAGCPGSVATGVCQLWSGRAGSGKLSPDEKSGWISAAREVSAAAAQPQPAMKTQTAVEA